MPRAGLIRDIRGEEHATPSKVSPLGVKGVGESGCTASLPALVTAALDAVRPLGIEHIDMPLTPEKVWRAWTDPEAVKRWWGPGPQDPVSLAELDVRVGGRFRIQMQNPDGEYFTAVGEFREVGIGKFKGGGSAKGGLMRVFNIGELFVVEHDRHKAKLVFGGRR